MAFWKINMQVRKRFIRRGERVDVWVIGQRAI